ncbi:hypothetical protein CSUB01_04045 [Colletotrichum sublineola]|uniref:Uncharacterized protein n=1 Tax=Colletotrichum sublineola TaxID=1173701 RepID=A0A066XHJ5_COLSU|nr:hypothetical protein CSUB01_04045 [Colletotrichum sublineola]
MGNGGAHPQTQGTLSFARLLLLHFAFEPLSLLLDTLDEASAKILTIIFFFAACPFLHGFNGRDAILGLFWLIAMIPLTPFCRFLSTI